MIVYKNLSVADVDSFWKNPTYEYLLKIIKENASTLTQDCTHKLVQVQSGAFEGILEDFEESHADQNDFYWNLTDQTGKNIRSINKTLYDVMIGNVEEAMLEPTIRNLVKKFEIIENPFMQEAIKVTCHFLDAKAFDLQTTCITWERLRKIHDKACISTLEPQHEDWASCLENGIEPSGYGSDAVFSVNGKLKMSNGEYHLALLDFSKADEVTGLELDLVDQCICHFQLKNFTRSRELLERWISEQQIGCMTLIDFNALERLPSTK